MYTYALIMMVVALSSISLAIVALLAVRLFMLLRVCICLAGKQMSVHLPFTRTQCVMRETNMVGDFVSTFRIMN